MNYMPRIYIVITGQWKTDVISTALAEDGYVLASHLSSSEQWARHDMGLDGSEWKHASYLEHYPEGYELVWVGTPKSDEDIDNFLGLRRALDANKRLAAEKAEARNG